MKTANILFLVFSLLSFLCMAQSGVYKHVNQDGHTIYSDTEIRGASKIDLPEITVMPAFRHSPASSEIKKVVTMPASNKAVEQKIRQERGQVAMSGAAPQNFFDKEGNQLSARERVQQIMEEMALYEDGLDALEMELYHSEGDY